MARVIIVSRTRMAAECVCVGGVDIDEHRSVRLLDVRGHHETANDCPYQIWDVWDIDYYLTNKRPIPHTEDAYVMRREKIDKVNATSLTAQQFAVFLENSNIPLFRGSLFTTFDGKLKLTDMKKMYISKDDVPNYSTCFWINDKILLGYYNDRGRWQYRYTDMSSGYGYTISYVGSEEPMDTIEPGSLVRLSLAHWWKPEDSDDDERCYLQLSGCLIPGKTEEMTLATEAMPHTDMQGNEWFDELEKQLDDLLLEKADIEERVNDLRYQIQQQMEQRQLEKLESAKYCISYSPAKTAMQFDSKTFKKENEELYSSYCVPNQKEASIVIRKKQSKE